MFVGHDAERVEHLVFDRLDHSLDVSLQIRRSHRRELDFAVRRLEHLIERIDALAITIPQKDFEFQLVVVDVHLKVAILLGRPLTGWVLGARRNPNLTRAEVNVDHEVNFDLPLQRPLLLTGKVALPKRIGVTFQEFVPSVRMVAWRRREAGFNDHVLHRLARNLDAIRRSSCRIFAYPQPVSFLMRLASLPAFGTGLVLSVRGLRTELATLGKR